MNSSYIVTTSVRGHSRTTVWDPKAPLSLGHPFHWIVERTAGGVRVRDVSGTAGKTQAGGLREIAEELLRKGGAEIELPTLNGSTEPKQAFTLKIRPAATMPSAFGGTTGDALTAFTCAGNWILNSATLGAETFSGKLQKKRIFTLRKDSAGYALHAMTEGLKLQNAADPTKETPIKKGETVKLDRAVLIASAIALGSYSWRFSAVAVPSWKENLNRPTDIDREWFKKSMWGALAGIALFMLITFVWPKPDETELVPPQMAKIIMAPTTEVKKTTTETASANSSAPEKVQKAAVVQAFRAKALQSAVSGLLKGGMTKLLAQSDFVTSNTDKARGIFNAKSEALMGATPDSGVMNQKNVAVTTIGGGGNGKSAGYGRGEHATVAGQGQAYVSMDIGGASVQEGLTKDEVGEVIHRHMSEIRYCYESAMIRSPDIEGKLVVDFTIGGAGFVKSSEVKSSTLPDPRLDDCVIRRLNTWKFPNPKGGVDVAVSYPFIFKTLGR